MTQETRQRTEQRDFASPDEVRAFGHGRLELLRVGDSEIGRLVLQPGWRWSEHVKPIAGTELCEAPHFQYHVAGTLRIRTADGAEFDATPGQVTSLPAGHDAWVVGDEDVVVVDWWGASNYARLPGDPEHGGNYRAGQPYSIAVAAEACVALEIAEAAANSDSPGLLSHAWPKITSAKLRSSSR
jgi:hypothetical protein